MIAGPEERAKVQNFLFEDGLIFSEKIGFLNPSKSSLFRALESVSAQKSCVVRHLANNWNSTLQYLEEVRETVGQLA